MKHRSYFRALLGVSSVVFAASACNTETPSAPTAIAVATPQPSFIEDPPTTTSSPGNLARNPTRTGYPHPMGSSGGWGGGSDTWDIVDGVRDYGSSWANGLAFTPCGWRQATIDFGTPQKFNEVVVWHHAPYHVPYTYNIQFWDGAAWHTVFSTIDRNGRDYLRYPNPEGLPRPWWYYNTPTVNAFPPVTGSKVKFELLNCEDPLGPAYSHGWIYEFEVYLTNQDPAADAGGSYSVAEGSALTLSGATASDPDAGDVLTYLWSVNTTGIDAGGSCSFSPSNMVLNPSITCTDDSQGAVGATFGLTLAVNDGNGHVVTDHTDLTVGNVAPGITNIVGPLAPVAVGPGNVTMSWSLADPGTDSPTCAIEWDTGLGFVAANYAPPGTCSAANSLPAGVYTVTVKGSDDDGGSAREHLATNVVVFDPDGGFVTGGGWIMSPRDAYAADPALTGKATLGFDSKYVKGKALPEGNTEFQFHAANLNFRSTSYHWLVVSGPVVQYKGAGTINGAGSYGFLVTARDGHAPGGGGIDKFRIKIWEVDGAVVYDGALGAVEDSHAAGSLGGGSVVIHARK